MTYQPKRVILNETRAARVLKRWQKLLRLQDWTITINAEPVRDSCNASSNINQSFRESIVTLNTADDLGGWDCTRDMELDIVHELIHCHVGPFGGEDASDDLERGIEALARAFVGMDREGK